jgi:addiction module HigA family antidote
MTEINDELKMKLAPVHPGEILLAEFMKPLGLSQTRLGRDLGVSARRINEIIHGKRSITADTALRLSRYFGTSAEFWLGLQADYDLHMATDRLGERIAREVKVFFPAMEAKEYRS